LHHGEDLAVDSVHSLFPSKLGIIGLKERQTLEYISYFCQSSVFTEKNILFQAQSLAASQAAFRPDLRP
jgi:hypothetical protein